MQSIITKLEEDVDRFKSSFQKFTKEKSDENTKLKEQLKGAIRRINYLVEEKERIMSEAKEKNSYISKLEMKIIQHSTNQKPNTSSGANRGVSPSTSKTTVKKAPLEPHKRVSVPNLNKNRDLDNISDGAFVTANSSLKKSLSKSNISKKEISQKRVRGGSDIPISKTLKSKDGIDELSSIQLMNYKFEDSPSKKSEEIENDLEETQHEEDHESEN